MLVRPVARAFPKCSGYTFSNLPLRRHVTIYGMSGINHFSTAASAPMAGAVVVGAGPGGITVVGNLLEQKPHLGRNKLVWADPKFEAGRVNASYREVPSNTTVKLFLQFANEVAPFRQIIDSTPKPNAVTNLQDLPQDEGCSLRYAADLCLMLSDGLARNPDVQQQRSTVIAATLDEQTTSWKVTFDNGETVTTPRMVLCTGSTPIMKRLPILEEKSDRNSMPAIDLDVALTPSLLAKTFNPDAPVTVGVVGASHSAILVLMNLVNLSTSSHPQLRIKWFTRNKLRYAEYKDGWILRDNTGLKGQAAAWARENLDEDTFATSPVSKVIKKVWTAENEHQAYSAELPDCTHIVQAVGYERNPLPHLTTVGKDGTTPEPLQVEFDNDTGRFFRATESSTNTKRDYVPGLFGAGIAFPERVTDPYKNVEYAVGFWKFMKFAKRVVPEWVSKP
ncbi:pyridine nucleotide-disulfide oxidoreductase-domain-containing protein [Biscogniauxia mediterranea]|nr:pyridine nucleotide-disulfide oxidoreductase-domain-containing protein [Biscogniauxia mediterranea]